MPPDHVACIQVATGIFHSGLSIRCVQGKGSTIYSMAPYLVHWQVVAQIKYGGYWHKTRSTFESRALSFPAMVSTTKLLNDIQECYDHQTSTCHHWSLSSPWDISFKVTHLARRTLLRGCPDQHRHTWYEAVPTIICILFSTANEYMSHAWMDNISYIEVFILQT